MSRINSQNFESAASRVAGAPFEIVGKAMANASGFVMPAAKMVGGGYVAKESMELGSKLINNQLGLASGDIANRVLYGATALSGTLAGGTLAALGVYDAVKETQRLIRKEA